MSGSNPGTSLQIFTSLFLKHWEGVLSDTRPATVLLDKKHLGY